jgi:Ca2+-transporting ATPase
MPTPESPHARPADELLRELDSGTDGLSRTEATTRLETDGPNALRAAKGVSVAALVVKQLRSPLIYLLFAATLLSLLAQHYLDAAVVATVLALNTLIGVSQEYRAEKTLEALKSLSAPQARVLRDAAAVSIPAEEVVVGDVLLLETGDRVAADARLIEVTDLRVDESALTGESDTVGKAVDAVDADAQLGDRTSMVWMTAAVTDGRGRAIVTATGMDTVIGEIAGEVQAANQDETPLQRRLARLGGVIGAGAVAFASLVFVIGLLRGYPLVDMMLFGVAVAVSAIPEGLPAVISVVLAVGVQRMAQRNAVVRRMPAVETLGSTTVICSDKTGTITRNEMTASRIWAGGRVFSATGEGFSPEGQVMDQDGQPVDPASEGGDLLTLLRIGAINNNAVLERDGSRDGQWIVEGNPTDGALLAVARKGGVPADVRHGVDRRSEIPFSSSRKYMATLDAVPGEEATRLHVKGAIERVLAASDRFLIGGKEVPASDDLRKEAEEQVESMADSALRVVAGAYRDLGADADEAHHEEAEKGLVFCGMWGLLDPPRPAAIRAIADARRAGISVKMITGDHATTAKAIASQAGILAEGEQVITGAQIDDLSDEDLDGQVEQIGVFARVSPAHKLRIVEALQRRGQIVAMTGDGVNDAPALKRADIGVSMGISGTEVAKESSDMILTDDDFATIVAAVEEGRVIFDNLRRVVMFLVTTNLGEILLITAALILSLPLPLTAIMILWVNLVTDGVSVVPLGLEPRHEDVLLRGPRPPKEGVLTKRYFSRILLLAPVIATGTLGVFMAYQDRGQPVAQTMAFTTLVAFEWFRAFSSRSLSHSVLSMSPLSNRLLLAGLGLGVLLQIAAVNWGPAQTVFKTATLGAADWALALAVASTVLIVDETWKLAERTMASGRMS